MKWLPAYIEAQQVNERKPTLTRKFLRMLDSESVRLYVWPFYLGLLAFGAYALSWLDADTALGNSMGHFHYSLWVWTTIFGTVTTLFGLALRHGGRPVAEMNAPLLFVDWLGLMLQLGGHLCVFWVLLDFEIYAARTINWRHDAIRIFAVFALSPYVIGCMFLAMQVARKLWHGEKLHRITREL